MRHWMLAGSAAALIAVGSARAVEHAAEATPPADVKIADDVKNGEGRFSGFDYATSDRFSRAWLVLHYRFEGPCRDSEGECELDAPVQVSVPGLTYDAAAKQVLYQPSGAEPVVCATVRSGGFLGIGAGVASTGMCTYRLVKVDRVLDDGFAGRKDRREEVHFEVRNR